MEVFDDVTHYLMPWHTFWRHEELCNVMVCSLLQGEFVVVMTYFMICLYCPDIFFHHFANKILSFDVMTNFLTSWCVLYFKVNLLLSWRISWPSYIVLTFFSHHFANKILWKRIFGVIDIMIYLLCYAKRLTSWQTHCHHAMFLINVLTSWQICWRHDMFLTSWRTFLTYLLTLWRVFDVIANLSMLWHVFDFMTHCFAIHLMSWQILRRHGVFLMSLTCFDVFVTSWLTLWSILHSLTSWRTFWCHGSFDDMTHFLRPDARHVFTLWRTFLSWWRIFVIISGTKYNVNVISILWRNFWCYDMLWCHDKIFDVMACFWLHDKRFDVVAYFLL